ncbi:SUMF1/EgtB/PvdO family nonheme iron enzyme [bacterium]|nr:SUMF1/EgtB/PvdO family nonheme iron enzyme [bacterium]
MLKRFTNLIILILTALIIYSCDNDDFVSPYDPSYSLPAPTNLVIEQIAVNQCRLTWQDNSQSETGFRIARKKDNDAWDEDYASLAKDMEEYIDEEVLPNSIYRYKVAAFTNDYVSSKIEESVSLNFPAPSNLQITQETVSSVRLTWEDNSMGEEGFKISRKKDNEDWIEEYDLVGENIGEYVDSSLETICYYYRIKAFYQEIESVYIENEVDLIPEDFVLVPAGTFIMGDTRGLGSSNELPTHQVTLSSFLIGKYEVTQGIYQGVTGTNPASNYGKGSNYPVCYVTWYDAVQYCNARSIEEGLTPCYNTTNWSCDFSANGYRLPTEAEWEFAARGGTSNPDYLYSGSDDLNSVAWYNSNSGSTTHNVGTKTPNSLGIYDMSGNVWEWCNDWYGDYSSSAQSDPVGPESGTGRVYRGGSWINITSFCRVAIRNSSSPTSSGYNIGFRLARSLN